MAKVPVKRKRTRRTTRQNVSGHMRRRSDVYSELGKLAGLVAFVCLAILGQAESLVGEWRPYISITATVCAAVWAYGMNPANAKATLKAFRHRRT